MAFGEVVFVVEDGDVSSYEAVGDVSSAVDVGSIHDDAVLYLGVLYGVVVSDARVGSYTLCQVSVWVVRAWPKRSTSR